MRAERALGEGVSVHVPSNGEKRARTRVGAHGGQRDSSEETARFPAAKFVGQREPEQRGGVGVRKKWIWISARETPEADIAEEKHSWTEEGI